MQALKAAGVPPILFQVKAGSIMLEDGGEM